jgi:hypothetical protein
MRARAGAGALAVAGLLWAALPLRNSGLAGVILFVAACCVALSGLRVGVGWLPLPENRFLASAPMRAWLGLYDVLQVPPWEDAAVVAIIWLEVLHPARPWHTAVLGVLVTAYLLVTHLGESGGSFRVLRPQARVLALGACLLAVAALVAATAPVSGADGSLLRILAALAAIAAAALALPAGT